MLGTARPDSAAGAAASQRAQEPDRPTARVKRAPEAEQGRFGSRV